MIATVDVLTFGAKAGLEQACAATPAPDSYALLHFATAQGLMGAGDAQFELSDGCVLCVPESARLDPSNLHHDARGTWLQFGRAERNQLLIDAYTLFCPYYGSRLIHLDARTQARVEFLIVGLTWLATHPTPHLQLEEAWVLQMLVETLDGSSNEKTDWGSLAHPQLRRFFEAVEQDFRACHQVEPYAQRIGVTNRTLLRLMRDAVGLTPKDFIAHRLNTEAKRLLISTNRSAQEIAFDLGFANAEYFYGFFKRLNQCSPTEFRNCLNLAPGGALDGSRP